MFAGIGDDRNQFPQGASVRRNRLRITVGLSRRPDRTLPDRLVRAPLILRSLQQGNHFLLQHRKIGCAVVFGVECDSDWANQYSQERKRAWFHL